MPTPRPTKPGAGYRRRWWARVARCKPHWLHDFLLDPYPIRPAVVLRMPKFNMSSAEASKLAGYFAAVDGVDYPYDFDPRNRASRIWPPKMPGTRTVWAMR